MKVGIAAALLAAALHCGPAVGQGFDPELQRQFLEAAQLLQAGDYAAAERVFRALAERTNSPRVKLELARTLFLLNRYSESRALFREVQLEPDVPWRVRDNVDMFMQRIDDILGYVKFSVSLVSDSNPRNITSEREFTIFGVRLTFQPPEDNEKVTGLRYAVQAYQPLLPQSRLSAYFTGSYLDYPTAELDRLTVDGGIAKELGEGGLRVKGGIEAGTFGDRRLYHFPYVGYLQPLMRSALRNVNAEFRLGKVYYPHYDYLDAYYASGTLSVSQVLSQNAAVSLAGTLEDSRAYERPYSYEGYTIVPGVAWLLTEPALLFRAELAYGVRRYADIDPLFGERRRDERTRLDFSVRGKQWRWMNFTPVLVFSAERNHSSLPFYGYRKANVSLMLE